MAFGYGSNLLSNPDTSEGLDHWTVDDVSIASDNYFRFEPTAHMHQTAPVPSIPPSLWFSARFLPGQDISSAAKVRAQIRVTLHYHDGTAREYVVTSKSFR